MTRATRDIKKIVRRSRTVNRVAALRPAASVMLGLRPRRMNGDLLGYHSFVQTGKGLRMLHGAFDRTRRTTHHCYENLIIHTVGYAIGNGLEAVHFGPVLNVTKQRMMNRFGKTRLYFYSNNPVIRFLFRLIFPHSRMQSKGLLAFKEGGVPHHPKKTAKD